MILLDATRRWSCPNCKLEQVTHEAKPHTRFHTCVGLNGLTAPMIEAGVKCEVRAVEREDYIGDEHTGRFMSVVTERNDGQDVAVFAPVAVARIG